MPQTVATNTELLASLQSTARELVERVGQFHVFDYEGTPEVVCEGAALASATARVAYDLFTEMVGARKELEEAMLRG